MNYGELLQNIPQSLRDLIRLFEKENRKLIKTEWSAKFYTSCLNASMNIKQNYVF